MKSLGVPLKSCPFCGGRADMFPQKTQFFKLCYLIRCQSCMATKWSYSRFQKTAAAEWNARRAPENFYDEVKVTSLKVPKRKPDVRNVAKLVIDLKRTGTLSHPLIVQQKPRGAYVIKDGLDRYEAIKQLGWTHVRVEVIPWDGEENA